jgi:hypothetical protein
MNSNITPPFQYYTSSPQTQRQPHDGEQPRLYQQQQQPPQIIQQYPQQQYHGQGLNTSYIQYPPSQFMTAPIQPHQQQPHVASGYAQQQMDMQNRLAHLQLQHPQQYQRSDRRTPSPTRQHAFPSQQGSSTNSRATINRSTAGISRNTLDRADAVRVKLEHLYKVSVEQAIERNQR